MNFRPDAIRLANDRFFATPTLPRTCKTLHFDRAIIVVRSWSVMRSGPIGDQ